ncbi:MAG: hypothetical protein Q8O38_01515 [Sulfurimicrobium sp.]|nr:hypothetical protein [Sulfurimicrobium sp.]
MGDCESGGSRRQIAGLTNRIGIYNFAWSRLKSHLAACDLQRELIAAALKYLGYSANEAEETHWRRARDPIIPTKPYWTAFNTFSYIKDLTVGNIWLAHGYFKTCSRPSRTPNAPGGPTRLTFTQGGLPAEGLAG